MKNRTTYEEYQLLNAILELSPEVRERVERLIARWNETDKIIRETNNVIPFRKG